MTASILSIDNPLLIDLPAPHISETATLKKALQSRHSTRGFLPTEITLDEISALLWAAFGVNRVSTGNRTAPSAHNWQEIKIYAVLRQGAYFYDAFRHRLLQATDEDLRSVTGTQTYVAAAPLNLVYVADFEDMLDTQAQEREFFAGVDTGCIIQNVYLYCASVGLATVSRGLIDRRHLAERLKLKSTQRIVLAQTVGHAA